MIGIVGAMEEEVKLLRESLQNSTQVSAGSLTFWSGELEGNQVVLVQCGIGKVNAATACSLLIEKFSPRAVINTGSAGGISPQLTFGDLLIATNLLQYDVDVTAFHYAPGQVPGLPPVFTSTPELVKAAQECVLVLQESGQLP